MKSLLVVVGVVGGVAFAKAAPPSQEAILEQSLAAREGLAKNYHLKMTIRYEEPDKQVSVVEVWAKGSLVRTDEVKLESTFDPDAVNIRQITCRNCERRGYGLWTRQGSRRVSAQVQFFPLDSDTFAKHDHFHIDWMRFGQLHGDTGMYTQEPADSTLRQMSTIKGEVSEVDQSGQRCYALKIPLDSGSTRRGDFCPQFGMNPVRYVDDFPKFNFRRETVVTYAKFPGADVWFPKEITHTRVQKGKVILSQKVVVEKAELNTAVPDSVFTLAGLGLDFGQSVAFPEIKDSFNHPTWGKNGLDWEQTVGKSSMEYHALQMKQATSGTVPVPDVAPSSGRWVYYAGAGVLAVLAVALAVVLARRRAIQAGA